MQVFRYNACNVSPTEGNVSPSPSSTRVTVTDCATSFAAQSSNFFWSSDFWERLAGTAMRGSVLTKSIHCQFHVIVMIFECLFGGCAIATAARLNRFDSTKEGIGNKCARPRWCWA